MHATDPLPRTSPAIAVADGSHQLTPNDLTPEQLAILAQVFRNALQHDVPVLNHPDSTTLPAPRSIASDPPPVVHENTVADFWIPVSRPEAAQPLPQLPTEPTRFSPTPLSTLEPTHPTPPAFPNAHDKQETATSEEQPLAPTLGASVLESIAHQSRPLAPSLLTPPVTTSPVHRIEKLEQVISETVNRMLISDPLHDGSRELRISLQQDVLPQTEVRLWRDAGRLHVEFVSTITTVEQTRLTDHLPRLAEAIHQRAPQGEPPVVSVRLGGEAGQPGDGRSRQHYQPVVEDDFHA